MKKEELRKVAVIGARSEIARLLGEVGRWIREFPELRKHARAAADAELITPEARTEKAIAKTVSSERHWTPEQRAKFMRTMNKKMRELHATRRKVAASLTDKAAAKKAHALAPVVKRSKRIDGPAKIPPIQLPPGE